MRHERAFLLAVLKELTRQKEFHGNGNGKMMAILMTIDTAHSASADYDTEDIAMTQVADFETIFLRFQRPITRFIAHRVDDYELAFDLTQDVFVKFYKALLRGTLIPRKAVSSWLYKIAINTVIDTQRKQNLLTFLSLSFFNEEGVGGVGAFSPSTGIATVSIHPPEDEDERHRPMTVPCSRQQQSSINSARFEERVADRQIIERVFARMSPKYRACLWLHAHEGLSCPQIGERLHISKTAAKMRLLRGRELFLTLYWEETGA